MFDAKEAQAAHEAAVGVIMSAKPVKRALQAKLDKSEMYMVQPTR